MHAETIGGRLRSYVREEQILSEAEAIHRWEDDGGAVQPSLEFASQAELLVHARLLPCGAVAISWRKANQGDDS